MSDIKPEVQARISTRTQLLARQTRHSGVGRAVVPMEAGTGFPVPFRSNERAYIIFPFFGTAGRVREGETVFFAPSVLITVDWKTGRPVEYIDCRFRSSWTHVDFTQPIGTFPHPAVAHFTRSEYEEKRQMLFGLYDQLFNSLTEGGDLSQSWYQQFSESFRTLLEPSLEPFYRALAPKFCEQFLGSYSLEK
jgi:hypothetical protein